MNLREKALNLTLIYCTTTKPHTVQPARCIVQPLATAIAIE